MADRRVSEPDSTAVFEAVGGLANAYVVQGRHEEARALYDETLHHEDLAIGRWITGEGRLSKNGPALVVYWESWCPFSQIYLPGVQRLYSRYEASVQVLGVTGQTKRTTEEQSVDFIERNQLSFPNAKAERSNLREIGFTGTPAVVALKDGTVVWRGHPTNVSEQFLDGLIGDSRM